MFLAGIHFLDLYVVDSIDSGLRRNDEFWGFAKGSPFYLFLIRMLL